MLRAAGECSYASAGTPAKIMGFRYHLFRGFVSATLRLAPAPATLAPVITVAVKPERKVSGLEAALRIASKGHYLAGGLVQWKDYPFAEQAGCRTRDCARRCSS